MTTRDRKADQPDKPSDVFPYPLESVAGTRGLLLLDSQCRIKFVDPGFGKIAGLSADELLGKSLRTVAGEIKGRFTDPDAFEAVYRSMTSKETFESVFEIIHPIHRVIHRYSAPLFTRTNRFVGRIEVYSDITKRRKLEEKVRLAYEELKATQEQLVQSEKLRAIGEIASGVAHDFNNTLGIILGNIQLLVRNADDPKVKARLEAVQNAALDAIETVRRIQEFTRIRPEETTASLDLNELAAEMIDVLRPAWQDAARARGVDIEVSLTPGPKVYALGVAPEIREVLANVLLNSIQAMPEGGKIEIGTGRSKHLSWVRVKDTGIGMTDDILSRIFDPFFTTRGVEGTGLGMSVAYGIVRRHDGTISVDSKPGEGTEVTISLPATSSKPIKAIVKEGESPKPAKILVVDDEEVFAETFEEMLSQCGHAVCIARTGEEAIKQFKENDFDLVFTDLGMPQMSGWQIAKTIKSIQPKTPVVLLTGWGAWVTEKDADGAHVDMILSKPVRFEDLASIVSKALAAKA